MSKRLALMPGWILLIGVSIACALASSATDTPVPPPTGTTTPEPTNTQPVVATFGATPQVVNSTLVITVAVTDTPTPTGTAPLTNAATPTPTDTSTPTPTATTGPTKTATKPKPTTSVPKPTATNAPLSINYEVQNTKRNPGNQAVITLHVIATGGSGGYKYYNDDVLQPGATFEVPGTCGSPLTHTLKVTSADGQSVSKLYFEQANCPTSTPTPKP